MAENTTPLPELDAVKQELAKAKHHCETLENDLHAFYEDVSILKGYFFVAMSATLKEYKLVFREKPGVDWFDRTLVYSDSLIEKEFNPIFSELVKRLHLELPEIPSTSEVISDADPSKN